MHSSDKMEQYPSKICSESRSELSYLSSMYVFFFLVKQCMFANEKYETTTMCASESCYSN
jgi:hypothetical protein